MTKKLLSGKSQITLRIRDHYSLLLPDKAGPLENSLAVADSDYDCNLFLCRGYQFEDNESRVLPLTGGDVVDIHVDIIAGHRPGYAVCPSVLSTKAS